MKQDRSGHLSTELELGCVVVGQIAGITDAGAVSVVIPQVFGAAIIQARSIIPLGQPDIGSEVAVTFGMGGAGEPLILGKMLTERPPPREWDVTEGDPRTPVPLEITAERELTLRCGKASITLTREGKIILRGTYISSRSSGANRIKGGSVQIN